MAFHPTDRDTDFLLPTSLQERLTEAHLARYVVDVIERADLPELEGTFAGRCGRTFHPVTLLSLLNHGSATA